MHRLARSYADLARAGEFLFAARDLDVDVVHQRAPRGHGDIGDRKRDRTGVLSFDRERLMARVDLDVLERLGKRHEAVGCCFPAREILEDADEPGQ